MRILVYGLNFAPELTGVGKYTGEMASWLGSQGHEVHVVTAPPYYPNWVISAGYRNAYQIEESVPQGDFEVYRCPLWVPAHPKGPTRLIHLCSFAMSSAPVAVKQILWKPQLVIAVVPTFFTVPMALAIAVITGAKSWLHIQDFEVDAAFKLAKLRPEFQPLARMLERFFTGAFSRVSTISERMRSQMVARGVSEENTILFPNWSDVEGVRPEPPEADNYFRNKFSLEGKTVLLYSGSMGQKQGLQMLADLAESFASDSGVHFVFCGDGVCKPALQRLVAGLPNVTMLSLQGEDRLNALLNVADVHLLPQDPEVRDLVMPSKLSGMLASGRPVLAVAEKDTQVASVVEGRGLVVRPCDPTALHAAARRLVDDSDLRTRFGQAGREYALMNLSKEDVLRRFERDIVALVASRTNSEEVQLAHGVSRLNRG